MLWEHAQTYPLITFICRRNHKCSGHLVVYKWRPKSCWLVGFYAHTLPAPPVVVVNSFGGQIFRASLSQLVLACPLLAGGGCELGGGYLAVNIKSKKKVPFSTALHSRVAIIP